MVKTTEKPIATDPAAEARRLFEIETQLEDRLTELDAERARAEQVTGASIIAELLDGLVPSAVSATSATDIEIQRHGIEHAIAECRKRRGDCIVAGYKQQAASLREQASKLQSEVDVRGARINSLLSELRALDEWDYAPSMYANRNGIPVVPQPGEGPRTAILAQEVHTMLARAVELESRPLPDSGAVHASDIAELLAKIADLATQRIAPRRPAVEAWAAEALVNDQKGWPGPGRRYQYVLCWLAGQIDPRRSTCESHEPRPRGYMVDLREHPDPVMPTGA